MKKFVILLTYENDFDPDLTSKDVEGWFILEFNLKSRNSLKIKRVKEIAEDEDPIIYFP